MQLNSFHHQQANARVCENRFKHYRAGEQASDLHSGPGDERVKRVAKDVRKVNAPLGNAPRTQADGVRLPGLIQHERPSHVQACANADYEVPQHQDKDMMDVREDKSQAVVPKREARKAEYREKPSDEGEKLQAQQHDKRRKGKREKCAKLPAKSAREPTFDAKKIPSANAAAVVIANEIVFSKSVFNSRCRIRNDTGACHISVSPMSPCSARPTQRKYCT